MVWPSETLQFLQQGVRSLPQTAIVMAVSLSLSHCLITLNTGEAPHVVAIFPSSLMLLCPVTHLFI